MTAAKFYLPDVGEGLTEAEIVSWKVKPGDAVDVNQVLVEIETAKSLVELPSPFAGTVGELLVAEGETVEVGTAIVTIESEGSSQLTAPTPTLAQAAMANEVFVTDASEVDGAKDANEEKSGSVLVGYGTGGHGATRRRRPSAAGHATPSPVPPSASEAPKRPVLPIVETLGVIAKPPFVSWRKTWMSTSRRWSQRGLRARSREMTSFATPNRRACSATSRHPSGQPIARSASRSKVFARQSRPPWCKAHFQRHTYPFSLTWMPRARWSLSSDSRIPRTSRALRSLHC